MSTTLIALAAILLLAVVYGAVSEHRKRLAMADAASILGQALKRAIADALAADDDKEGRIRNLLDEVVPAILATNGPDGLETMGAIFGQALDDATAELHAELGDDPVRSMYLDATVRLMRERAEYLLENLDAIRQPPDGP